jgi:hypothetical protein
MSESHQLDEPVDPTDLDFDQEPLDLENLMSIENPTQDPAAEAADLDPKELAFNDLVQQLMSRKLECQACAQSHPDRWVY